MSIKAPKSAAAVAKANKAALKASVATAIVEAPKDKNLDAAIEQLPTKKANPKAAAKPPVAEVAKVEAKPKAEKVSHARPDSWVLSVTAKPTKKVWNVADSMPGASRKEVIAACIAQGIAPGTSRTQYQAWFKAMRDSGTPAR